MNLTGASVVLRHRSALEVVDLALRFVRSVAPRLFLRLMAISLIPAWLGCLALRHYAEMPWWGVWLVALCCAALLELPFTVAAGRLLFDQRLGLGEVLRESTRASFRYAVSQFLRGSLLVVSALVVVGPLFVSATYCFAAEACVLERAGPFRSLGRARAFLRGRSGTGVETVFLHSALTLTFVLMGEILGQTLLSFVLDVHSPVDQLFEDGGSPFALAGLWLAVPYRAVYRFLAYANERTRQDGWDIQVAFMGIASEHGSTQPGNQRQLSGGGQKSSGGRESSPGPGDGGGQGKSGVAA